MRILARFLLLALLFAGPLHGAEARDLTDAEKQQLQTTVENFDKAMRAQDYATVIDAVPPRLVDLIAKQAGYDPVQIRAGMVELTMAAMAQVKIEDFGMDFSAAATHALPNGDPYVLIPTVMVMNAEAAGKLSAKSETLALLDDGQWYLVRVSEPQQARILRQAYPQFASIEFSSETMEAVK